MIQPLGCVKSAATPAEIEVCPRKDACLSFCGRGRFLCHSKRFCFCPVRALISRVADRPTDRRTASDRRIFCH